MKLTGKQIETLKAATRHPLGYVERRYTNNGLGSASRRRMLNRLSLVGFVRENAHGDYEITDSGRAEIDAH